MFWSSLLPKPIATQKSISPVTCSTHTCQDTFSRCCHSFDLPAPLLLSIYFSTILAAYAILITCTLLNSKACIKGHRSSQCNHIGGPLWAVRPAGRPNKACIHGPGDLCLCAHYFPLTFLKAAVPRNKKCPCSGSLNGKAKCSCGAAKNNDAAAVTTEDETHPIFYQDLVARGLQVTTEPVDLSVPAPTSSCCGPAPLAAPEPVEKSCCSRSNGSSTNQQIFVPAPSSCCAPPVKTEPGIAEPVIANGHNAKSDSISSAPFTPIQQFRSPPGFSDLKFESPMTNSHPAGLHVCECGPTCNCVLCIDHPYNQATMNHINTEFGQMMSHDTPFSPTNGTQPDYFPQGWLANGGMMPPNFSDPALLAQYQMMQQQQQQQHQRQLLQQQHSPQSHSPPSQATDMDIILNPADFEMFNFAFPPTENGAENNNGNVDMMDFGLPDIDMDGFCGGMPDGCPCGDDCACIGCQVHKPTNGTGLGQQQQWP